MFARLLIKTSAHTDPDAYRWLGFGADAVKPAPFRGGDGAPSCLVVKGRGTVLTGLTIVHVICAAEHVGRSEAVQVRGTSALLCSEAERFKTNPAAHSECEAAQGLLLPLLLRTWAVGWRAAPDPQR